MHTSPEHGTNIVVNHPANTIVVYLILWSPFVFIDKCKARKQAIEAKLQGEIKYNRKKQWGGGGGGGEYPNNLFVWYNTSLEGEP